MDEFLDTYTLSWWNHEEMKNLNRPIMSINNESIIGIFPSKKSK
jgi:hypothetical protein